MRAAYKAGLWLDLEQRRARSDDGIGSTVNCIKSTSNQTSMSDEALVGLRNLPSSLRIACCLTLSDPPFEAKRESARGVQDRL